MRILIDMDGTIADWGREWNRCLDTFGQEARMIPRHRDQRTFDLHHERTPEEVAIIAEVMDTMNYGRLRSIPGSRSALRAMVRAGHDVALVSTPWPTNYLCASEKTDWVRRVYGASWTKRLVLTHDKTCERGDILIDDKPQITGKMDPEWEHIVFTQPYNMDITDKRRMNAWGEWESIVNV